MKKLVGIFYRGLGWLRGRQSTKYESDKKYADTLKKYAGHEMLNEKKANQALYDMIMSGKPFLAGRFGSTELLNMRSYEFGGFIGQKYDKAFHFNHLCEWSGFFPQDISLLPRFYNEMVEACKECDFLAVWFKPFEDYYIRKYMSKKLKVSYLLDFEPWTSSVHWSAALKGKKVLVIHPFESTIRNQYMKRELLFNDSEVLPEFELHTLKAVQTLAGTEDKRFKTWFDALNWMYDEAMKIDFDIAIIGCGAYGLPLAAKIKKSGKQAIHLAGATQLLFGIKGRRWEEDPAFDYIKRQFNEQWVYPGTEDVITNAKNVEGGCYWK